MICMGSHGLWSNDSMLQIKMCATNSKTRMLCTNHKTCSTEDLWNHNFPFCFWVMVKTIFFQNIMIITLKLSYYISGWFYFSSAWILNLWTKGLFLKSQSLTTEFYKCYPWVQVDVCARHYKIPSRHFWDISFTGMGLMDCSNWTCLCFLLSPLQYCHNKWW